MNKEKSFSAGVPGASSLLRTFGLLCLTVFALITLTTANANSRMADRATRSVTRYYKADLQAEEIFARLRRGEIPAGVNREGDVYKYSCEITAERTLYVELEKGEDTWTILRWQEVVAAPEPDEHIDVFQG